ncbi:sterol desaturase family protein [Nocardia sp. BMG51109]|uniref:sterol desaturase family protein n=1 Tax=Nocardia sp. BMG51109 TaxID=1056816 RepID=UPI0004AF03D6|nr:sterol desaturase family protein [Nocardia sp. BMG51109]
MKFKDPIKTTLPLILLALATEMVISIGEKKDRQEYLKDVGASVLTGGTALAPSTAMKALATVPYMYLYEHVAPKKRKMNKFGEWLVLFVAVDLGVYVFHRSSHAVRVLWAGHQVHHSSEYLNISTAFRRKWALWFDKIIWLPLPLAGFHPAVIYFVHAFHLVYGAFAHSEKIGTLPKPVEAVLVTPSHHRVHHGTQQQYIDKNFGSILILWDRLFGTFVPEGEQPVYGLTKQVGTFNLWELQTYEFKNMIADVRSAKNRREALMYVFGRPGWRPPVA